MHHSIRRSLDSHDSVEVEAAIYAAQMFAAQSKLFAVSMCSKISDMIRGQATPASMKLQLIPILQYMHHDTFTASMVCKILYSYILYTLYIQVSKEIYIITHNYLIEGK